jgi:hypothetical protein
MSAFGPIAEISGYRHRALMAVTRCLLVSIAGASSFASVGCSTPSQAAQRCDVASLESVIANPLAYSGRTFCGKAFAIRPANSRVTYLIGSPSAPLPRDVNDDRTAILVATKGSQLLGRVPDVPTAYYIEAGIRPQTPCWTDAGPNNTCVPWIHPVSFHIQRAKRAN